MKAMKYRYWLELSLCLMTYVLILVYSLNKLNNETAWPIVVSIMPMVPALVVCWVIIRGVRSMDELQRKIQFEAMVLAFAATALLTFSYGFLENVGFPKMTMFVVWPLMASFWVIGTIIGSIRYR
ncbi:hypothetical protein [Halomonas sp. SpR8]|uniref:hypothetical protein n=1 Tax=Halomonas sp. SpR8 TaxID=3050463 RepID=UPI0027E415A6|nr:hypothetical protein [Halomonas sp. SpR8]MDQ7727093.1 hypothetical protein [Halomonas sp. SpR8]